MNVTWVRLEQLQPSSRYVACVRAITHDAAQTQLLGDWSFVHIFETQRQGAQFDSLLTHQSYAPPSRGR